MPDVEAPRPPRTYYVPCGIEELSSQVSDSAIVLLLRIRRRADTDMSDGFVATRVLRGIAQEAGHGRVRLSKLVDELVTSGHLAASDDGVWDARFDTWCKTKSDRLAARKRWQEINERRRKKAEAALLKEQGE